MSRNGGCESIGESPGDPGPVDLLLPDPGRPLVRRDLPTPVLRQNEEEIASAVQSFVALLCHGVGPQNQTQRGNVSKVNFFCVFGTQENVPDFVRATRPSVH